MLGVRFKKIDLVAHTSANDGFPPFEPDAALCTNVVEGLQAAVGHRLFERRDLAGRK